VALRRDQRWEGITPEDEAQARRPGAQAHTAAVPEVPWSDDVRLVLLAQQVS